MRNLLVVSAQLVKTCKAIPLRAQLRKKSNVSTTSRRDLSCTAARSIDFTHAVIGAGAVGLAIARQLAQREGTSTILIERHGAVGTETSSRNSEVIHAGLYYGRDSLKKKLCIRGKEMIYELCDKYAIPYKKTGKWIVAQTDEQWERLVQLHEFSRTIDVPTHFVSLSDAARLEPSVRAQAGILASPTTGILDSHAYMQHLLGAYLDTSRGDIAYHTTATSISPLGTPPDNITGYEITTRDSHSPNASAPDELSTITASTLINAAGLGACAINNLLLPPSRHKTPFYAKGNYFAYSASSPRASRLIYPAPEPGLGGLGTHLTLDLAGALRFGPDVEWVDSPDDLSVSVARLPAALREIRKYFPGLQAEALRPDYAGVRPKLAKGSAVAAGGGSGKGKGEFVDFVIREEEGFKGFVNLLGIESPGLTSSLAIAEMVEEILYR